MKSKIIFVLFLLLVFFSFGCDKNEVSKMYIQSEDYVIIDNSMELKVFYEDMELSKEKLGWTLSDYSVASINNDGVLYAKDYGKVVVTVVDKTNPMNYCAKEIEVIAPVVTDIVITGETELLIHKTIELKAQVLPEIIETPIVWESSNENIILVENGKVYAVAVGVADVIVKCDDFEKRYTITVNPEPTEIIIKGSSEIMVDGLSTFEYNIEDEVYLESSDNEVAEVIDTTVIGKKEGKVTITAYKKSNPEVKGTIEITVVKGKGYIEMTSEEETKINEIISNMSLEQLVGQMFNVGITAISSSWEQVAIDPTTGLPYAVFSRNDPQTSVVEYLSNYKFGNFTIKSTSGSSRENLLLAIKTLNQMGKNNTGINPFISYEYTGGRVMQAITAIPSNQALGSANTSTVNSVSNIFASELQALGINLVNNAYANTADFNDTLNKYNNDITKSIVSSEIVNKAYNNYGIVMMPSLSVSYAYEDSRSVEELKESDFRLIQAAINNGCQMLALPTSFYGNEYNNYLFLSPEFMEDYLREELNYQGVVVIDNKTLETYAYDANLYNYAISAINLGVDMINFDIRFTTSRWNDAAYVTQRYLELYEKVLSAANSEEISIDRIKEAVTRILLVKLRNGILEEKQPIEFDYENVDAQLMNYMTKFISVEGELYKLSSEDNILIISQTYESTGTTNSVGDNLYKYLSSRGYKNVKVEHFNTLSPTTTLNNVQKYNKILIAFANINQNTKIGYAASAVNFLGFVKDIQGKNKNICNIYVSTPDYNSYFEGINNSVYLYNFYEEDFESLCRVLSQESEPNTIK